MGSYVGDAEGAGFVPQLAVPEDRRDIRSSIWGEGMRMVIGGGGLGGGGAVTNEGVHLEAIGYHYGIYH